MTKAPAIVLFGGKLLFLALFYAGSGWIGRRLDVPNADVRVFMPQSGVALAFLTLWGGRYWPAILVGSLYLTLSHQVALRDAVALALANSGSAALGAYLLRRSGFDPTFATIRDLYNFFLFGLLIVPLVNALAAAGLAWAPQWPSWSQGFPVLWRRWYGHGISHLIVAPVLLTWSRRWTTAWPQPRRLELMLLVSLLLFMSMHAFTGRSALVNLNYPLSFAPFPFVIWAGLRFGPRGATTATFLVAAFAIYGTSRGFGPFVHTPRETGLVLLQVYLTAVSVSGLFLASAVAERRSAMAQLRSSREQLRALSGRLQSSREEERALLSREIHDELGQQLTSLKIGLKSIRKRLVEQSSLPPDLVTRLDRLSEVADESVHTIRRIASDLRPGMLDDLGLVPSLEWLVRQFQERSGIEASFFSTVPQLHVSEGLSIAVFRIVQESLTNVARHAEAQSVQVHVWTRDSTLRVEIRDDGRGMPAHVGAPIRKSLGIIGMQERARIVDGELNVISPIDPDEVSVIAQPGTLIHAVFPLPDPVPLTTGLP